MGYQTKQMDAKHRLHKCLREKGSCLIIRLTNYKISKLNMVEPHSFLEFGIFPSIYQICSSTS